MLNADLAPELPINLDLDAHYTTLFKETFNSICGISVCSTTRQLCCGELVKQIIIRPEGLFVCCVHYPA